jgi:HPt (histidine-containing phosphotransfer) domain-containing protein
MPAGSGPLNGLNTRAFEHYARGAPGEAGQAAQLYFSALEEEDTALRHALANNDADRVATAAHRMRALGGLVGAKPLADAARDLENVARQGSRADRQSAYDLLAPRLAALKTSLRALKPSDASPV